MENQLLSDKHILIYTNNDEDKNDDNLFQLKKHFCGQINHISQINPKDFSTEKIIYLCGNIHAIHDLIQNFPSKKIYIVREVSYHYENLPYEMITLGKVPINIHNVGIYFRRFFYGKDYFQLFNMEHKCQSLTESNKPGFAFRKGIYLSHVKEIEKDKLQFHLLRCSSNLDGPTDQFRTTDCEIINQVQKVCDDYFSEKPNLNHVLAQVYYNNEKKKAKISPHADKTKDMPSNGVIAFCTFYQFNDDNAKNTIDNDDPFDINYKNTTSVLTKMRFRLKKSVEINNEHLIKEFTIPLYPNSVFIIPLSTNRLYTHEIRPSILSPDKLPTRLGYVIRCSKTQALYENNQTYIEENNNYIPLQPMTEENKKKLQELYYEENVTDHKMNYGSIHFSMNEGDYKKPMRQE